MWNIATDPRDHVTNNKDVTPDLDLVFPFSISTNNDEMSMCIKKFDLKKYETDLDCLLNSIGVVFAGNASAKLAKVIVQMLWKDKWIMQEK